MDPASGSRAQPALFVLWQSLVVDAYRSFFTSLANATSYRIALAAPAEFRELAQQQIRCPPFAPPFDGGNARHAAFILPAFQPHVQIVIFAGLAAALRRFYRRVEPDQRVFMCVAEPYSITALAAYVAARLVLGKEFKLLLYSAQNIYRDLAWPLARLQAWLFRRCFAILSIGEEQDAVLRRYGYVGAIIRFPLWFDEHRLTLGGTTSDGRLPTFGYAGALTQAKGLVDLLECFEQHADQWAGRCSLRLAGAGPLTGLVRERCQKLRGRGLDATFLGALPAASMPDFYRSIDALIVPSRTTATWKEQFGRVIIEARAVGAVALGSDSGEIPRVVGGDNRLFAEGDLAAMARVIEHWTACFREPGSRAVWRKAEALAARSEFAADVLAKRFVAQLEALLHQRASGANAPGASESAAGRTSRPRF